MPVSRAARRFAPRATALAFLLACLVGAPAAAGEIYHSGGVDVRWDNTLRYSAAFRLFSQDPALISNPNYDDGDRNFAPGLVSNRLDLLSELDIDSGDIGARLSVAGWYDTVYHQRNDNDSPRTFNPQSVPHDQFTRSVRRLHGQDVQLGDAFLHGAFDSNGVPVSFRLGRYALLWGESLFFGENGISGGQAPTDIIRELNSPSGYAKDVFLPVWQASFTLQPLNNVTLGAYYQLQWRGDQLPGAGSYFSYADFYDVGGERYILPLQRSLFRAPDFRGRDTGQFGLSLQFNAFDANWGLYALRFNSKEPEIYFYNNVYRVDPRGFGDGLYRLVYPSGVNIFGASANAYLGDSTIAGEISLRTHTPLVADPITVPTGVAADGGANALYPIGDTLHGQISSQTTFAGGWLWRRAELDVELAANDRLSIVRNAAALEPGRTAFASAIQASFAPQYFEALPGLDLSLPIGLGYGLTGRSSVLSAMQAGTGDLELGVSATYLATWQANLTYTRFLGGALRQTLADRDFILFSVQRTL